MNKKDIERKIIALRIRYENEPHNRKILALQGRALSRALGAPEHIEVPIFLNRKKLKQ